MTKWKTIAWAIFMHGWIWMIIYVSVLNYQEKQQLRKCCAKHEKLNQAANRYSTSIKQV